jgi:peptidoglycan biosynthesis protein MviN/MurJ (putative lipid II flippase)
MEKWHSSLYGSEYGAGNIVLTVFSIGLFIKSIFLIYSSIIVATRKIKSQLLIAICSALVNTLLNFALIPSYGIIGATFATTFSILIYGVVTFIEAKGLFKLEFPNLAAPFVCALISSIVLLVLHNQFYSLIPFFNSTFSALPFVEKISAFLFMGILFLITSLIYLSLLILFKSFSDSELLLLESTLVRLRIPKTIASFILSIFGKKN